MTEEELKALLHYDAETGFFTWKTNRQGTARAGRIAGNLCNNGYLTIQIKGKNYRAHRLAFLFMTGEFPTDMCDHINGIRDDNRWVNLRQATRAENNQNRSISSANTSGVKGVCWDKFARKWQAQICINSKNAHLGYFTTLAAAELAVQEARIKLHGEFSNHGN
ncbi:hypothetical protein J3D56_003910 [Erwinia persicina]|uniref:HNH endonuclease n=1 Tax=Erwinia persicina TaxID=55211 RepID=UPI00209D80B3|nr:HNH endonuclease [Erwinia persicina]MCP1440474.1 hypothetical protein [Erwinia persicina]